MYPDNDLHNEVDLYFELTNCPKYDRFSQSDPFIVVFTKSQLGERKGQWIRLGNTEIIWDNHNPRWVKAVRTDFFFEQVQLLRFDVYDADANDTHDLSRHDFVGSCTANLGELCHAVKQKKQLVLMRDGRHVFGSKRRQTKLLVRVEEVIDNQDELEMTITGHNLAAMDWFGTSDPYVEFLKPLEDGSWLPVARTETLKGTVNPRFKKFSVKLAMLCNADINIPLKMRCLDWNLNSDPDLIGEAEITVRGILSGENAEVVLKNPQGSQNCCGFCARSSYGIIRLRDAQLSKGYSFLQYLQAGLEIQLVVAIDFTGSNGDPRSRESLHAINKEGGNDYQRAIRQVMEVLEPYDSDGMIPVYGFGCRIKGDKTKRTNHCMPLTFDENNAEVAGAAGVMQVYDNAVQVLELSGPTLFQQILETAAAISDMPINRSEQTYTILLILTDGIINDMEKSINAIVQGGKLPLSIIIVGVGNADFSNMDILDADDEPLRHSNGELMPRDIVQFVPFNEFRHEKGLLAAETLREVPDQVTDYMKMVKMAPMPENSVMSMRSLPGDEKDYMDYEKKYNDNRERERLLKGNNESYGGNSNQAPKVNNAFLCPITREVMTNPVIAADGFTYERSAIERWLETKGTSPQTNLALPSKQLIPNHSLKSMIVEQLGHPQPASSNWSVPSKVRNNSLGASAV